MKCEVCSQNDHKYKCPKCKIHYCSLPCYKTHQENCKTLIETQNLSNSNESSNTYESNPSLNEIGDYPTNKVNENKFNFDTEDLVNLEKFRLLGESEELKTLLRNPHLRDLLKNLNEKSVNTIQSAMDQAMHEPIFTEFADVCLKLVQDKHDLNDQE